MCWPVVLYKRFYTTDITPEMTKFPEAKFAVMGGLDTAYNLMSTWPTPYLAGPLLNLLSNVILPMTMVGSILFLKTRYKASHCLGAVLVVYAIMVQLLPQLFEGEGFGDDGGSSQKPGLWVVILILAGIPAAASNVYKEIGLKDTLMDEWYMNAKVAIWQLVLGLLTVPTVAIPFPKPAPIITFRELPNYLGETMQCFFAGKNSINDPDSPDDCEGTWQVFCIYILFNVAYNNLSLVIFKRGSSALFTVASVLRLPVVDALLLVRFIAGPKTSSGLTAYDYYALVAMVLGIATYYHQPEVRAVAPDAAKKDKLTDDDYEPQFPVLHSPHAPHGRSMSAHPPQLDRDAWIDDEMAHTPSTRYGALVDEFTI